MGALAVRSVDRVAGAIVVDDLFSYDEREAIIAAAEAIGLHPKKSRRSGPPIRNNTRAIVAPTAALTAALERRLLPVLSAIDLREIGAGFRLATAAAKEAPSTASSPTGFLNPKWRVNAYASGEMFFPHWDSGHVFGPARRTLLSVIAYLNDDFDGGETLFYTPDGTEVIARVTPRAGSALVFPHYGPHSPLHGTAPIVTRGRRKFIARTDVIYDDASWGAARLFPEAPGAGRPIVLLLGVPGAGKSTQLDALAAKRGWSTFNFGAAVRGLRGTNSPLAHAIEVARSARAAGTMWLPDDVSARVFHEVVPSSRDLLVLDGYPRKRSQSIGFETSDWQLLTVVHLRVSADVQRARLVARAARAGFDLETRMADWTRDTLPLVDHYRKRGVLVEIDGAQAPEVVTDEIERAVEAARFDALWALVPAELRASLDGYVPTKLSASKKGYVYPWRAGDDVRFWKTARDPDRVSTIAHALTVARDAALPLAIPRVLASAELGTSVSTMVTDRVPGVPLKAAFQRRLAPAPVLARQWAEALAAIHAHRPSPAAFPVRSVADLVAIARARLLRGEVRAASFAAKYRAASPDAAPSASELPKWLDAELAEIERACAPSPSGDPRSAFTDVRLAHGDACAPNFIWEDAARGVTGCVDVAAMAWTDIHWDLCLARWSLVHNAGPDAFAGFLEAYEGAMREKGDPVTVAVPKLDLLYRLARFLL